MAQRETMAQFTKDYCTITHDESVDYFIRAVLEIPVIDHDTPMQWGVWVSLRESNYLKYMNSPAEIIAGERWFGWVCNTIHHYPIDRPRPATVIPGDDDSRPLVWLNTVDGEEDQMVADQRQGISRLRTQALVERLLHA